MALPTAYTEYDLAAFFRDEVLKKTATLLDWTQPDDYQGAVNDTLIAYGVEDIADATNIPRLRAIGRREVWRAVVEDTAGMYGYTVDGETYNRQQINAQARAAFDQAEKDAQRFEASISGVLDGGTVSVPVQAVW